MRTIWLEFNPVNALYVEKSLEHSFLQHQERSQIVYIPYPCEECWQIGTCVLGLRTLEKTDFVEKPYQCQETGDESKRCMNNLHSKKKFEHKKIFPLLFLQEHVRMHNGDKSYEWKLCKVFRFSSYLGKHVRIQTEFLSSKTHENTYCKETLWMQAVYESLQVVVIPTATCENPLWREMLCV